MSLSELSQSHVPMESELDPGSSLPSFVSSNNNTLVTSVGQTVYLYCGVHNLGDRQVNYNYTLLINWDFVNSQF